MVTTGVSQKVAFEPLWSDSSRVNEKKDLLRRKDELGRGGIVCNVADANSQDNTYPCYILIFPFATASFHSRLDVTVSQLWHLWFWFWGRWRGPFRFPKPTNALIRKERARSLLPNCCLLFFRRCILLRRVQRRIFGGTTDGNSFVKSPSWIESDSNRIFGSD